MTTEERVKQLINIEDSFKQYSMDQFVKYCLVGESKIKDKTRIEDVRMNRQLACVFGFSDGMTLQRIGIELGGIDHATVLHGIRVVYDDFIYGKKMKQYLNTFIENIQGYSFGYSVDLSSALISLENNLNDKQLLQCTN